MYSTDFLHCGIFVAVLPSRKNRIEMENDEITSVFAIILSKLEKIEHTLSKKSDNKSDEKAIDTDCWFNIDELCAYHPDHPTHNTVYAWVRDRKIPHYKTDRKLRFLKSEIDAWLSEGRVRTIEELDAIIQRQKGGRRA